MATPKKAMTMKLAKELAERGIQDVRTRVGCGKIQLDLKSGRLTYASEAGTPQELPMDAETLQRIIDFLEVGKTLWAANEKNRPRKSSGDVISTINAGDCRVTFHYG